MRRFEQYQDMIARIMPEAHTGYTDNGKRILSRTFTFKLTDDCNLACFVAGTKILMSDFSYKNIEDVQVGDMVLAFDEHLEKGKQLKLIPTKVTHTFYRHDKVRKISTTDGDSVVVTDEHPFLDGRRNWIRAEDINLDKKLTKFFGIADYNKADINSTDYAIGYVIAVFLGDGHMGFYKHCRPVDSPNYQCRLAVKDDEIIDRVKKYLNLLDINYTLHPFKVSEKYNLVKDAIYLNGNDSRELKKLIENYWNKYLSFNYCCGFLAGIIDTEGYVEDKVSYLRIVNCNEDVMRQCETALSFLNYSYVYEKTRQGVNYPIMCMRVSNIANSTSLLQLLLTIQTAIPRKSFPRYYGTSAFKRQDVSSIELINGVHAVYNLETESHTYIANNFAVHNCTYCYQSHKNAEHRMTWDVAKRAVDMLLTGENGMKDYIDPSYSPAIIIEFIGGEPFLEIDLMDKICDYFIRKAIEMQHPWAEWHMFSICSNGVLYFDDRVQRFLEKHKNKVSFSITIDGNKELHDSCRVFPDGRPSYDLAVAAAKDWMSRGYYMGSKITIAPGNVMHVADAIKHMVDLGYTEINANCVYEEGWNYSHATVLYQQMKELSDYFLENNFNFEREFFCSLWEENFFKPKDPDDNENWCFRAGTMILTPHGNVPIETIKVGDEVITGNGNVKHVENIMTHFADDPVLIIASDISPIWTTSNHPFLTRRENGSIEWVKAKDLKMTDCLKLYTTTKEQHWVGICELHTDDIKGYDVYNMTVSDDHTFVANGIVVHNCGGIGEMLAIDYAGRFFPCIRYMEDSLAGQQEPYSIGDLEHGVCVQQCDKDKLACLQCITRRSQSTDECFYCPIAEGCSWWIRPL